MRRLGALAEEGFGGAGEMFGGVVEVDDLGETGEDRTGCRPPDLAFAVGQQDPLGEAPRRQGDRGLLGDLADVALQRFMGDIFPRLYESLRGPVVRRRTALFEKRMKNYL
ncbi:MAG: hypothetical protein WDA75_09850 [Candidatus Latescibacterota bacterium]